MKMVSILKTHRMSYEKGKSHFLLTKFKHRNNWDADAMNIDRIEESKELHLNLITKITY